MATTRIALRQDIIRRLYPGLVTVSETTGISSGTELADINISTDIPKETLIGGYVYFTEFHGGGVDIGDTARVINVKSTVVGDNIYWRLFMSPSVGAAVWLQIDYEFHYIFHPEDINDVINDVIRFGTRSTLSSLTSDTDSTVFERDVLVNGAMAILKRRLAVSKTGSESDNLNVEAQIHENDYLEGLSRQGYEAMTQVKEINVGN